MFLREVAIVEIPTQRNLNSSRSKKVEHGMPAGTRNQEDYQSWRKRSAQTRSGMLKSLAESAPLDRQPSEQRPGSRRPCRRLPHSEKPARNRE
jgi:hypothetical protein